MFSWKKYFKKRTRREGREYGGRKGDDLFVHFHFHMDLGSLLLGDSFDSRSCWGLQWGQKKRCSYSMSKEKRDSGTLGFGGLGEKASVWPGLAGTPVTFRVDDNHTGNKINHLNRLRQQANCHWTLARMPAKALSPPIHTAIQGMFPVSLQWSHFWVWQPEACWIISPIPPAMLLQRWGRPREEKGQRPRPAGNSGAP